MCTVELHGIIFEKKCDLEIDERDFTIHRFKEAEVAPKMKDIPYGDANISDIVYVEKCIRKIKPVHLRKLLT